MSDGYETRWVRTASTAKKSGAKRQTRSMGNNGDKGEETKMWEEHDIEGNEKVKMIGRKDSRFTGKKGKRG